MAVHRANASCGFGDVHPRHTEIEKHDVGIRDGDLVERLAAVDTWCPGKRSSDASDAAASVLSSSTRMRSRCDRRPIRVPRLRTRRASSGTAQGLTALILIRALMGAMEGTDGVRLRAERDGARLPRERARSHLRK